MSCPFCHLERDEATRIIQAGTHVRTFLSNPRLMPGHLLVAPKRHIEKPWEMTAEERREIFDTLLLFQEKLTSLFFSGCDIREHYRPFIPQSQIKVHHVHFHLHPREPGDELYQTVQKAEKTLWQNLDEKEAAGILTLLKKT